MTRFSVRQLCSFTLVGALGLLLMLFVVSIMAKNAVREVAEKHAQRYRSYLLADELRQSSDDLTRLARTYVVTGDARYEQQYNDILDIRNGRKPRPDDYHRIYWDFVAATDKKPRPEGKSVALQELMKQAGFSEQEFAKLKQAQANSDALVRTEVIAMNAVKGRFDNGAGTFSIERAPDFEIARELMHNRDYHKFKGDIMGPVDEFFVLLEERTGQAIAAAEEKAGRFQLGLNVVLLGSVDI